MNNDIDVSFIVPMKNEKATILECVNSIIHNANHMDYSYEVIAIDDHSTDGTVDILNTNRFSGTILSAGTITGPATVRNYAAALAKGKVLVFIDGDVILNPDWHEFFPETYQHCFEYLACHTASNPDLDNRFCPADLSV